MRNLQFWLCEEIKKGAVTFGGLGSGGTQMFIATLDGTMTASIGDWIIRGVKGEIYPCKPDIFEETYEPVTEGLCPI